MSVTHRWLWEKYYYQRWLINAVFPPVTLADRAVVSFVIHFLSHLSLLCLSLPIYFSITHLSSPLIQYIVSPHFSCFMLFCFQTLSLYFLSLLFVLFSNILSLSLSVSETRKCTMRMWTFKRSRKAELSLSSLATTSWCPSKRKRRRVQCVCVSGCLCPCGAVHA